jgi:hypothetical protein
VRAECAYSSLPVCAAARLHGEASLRAGSPQRWHDGATGTGAVLVGSWQPRSLPARLGVIEREFLSNCLFPPNLESSREWTWQTSACTRRRRPAMSSSCR